MKTSITKYIIGGVIVAAFAAYVIFGSNQNGAVTALPSSSPSGTAPVSSSSPSSQISGTSAGTPSTGAGTSATAGTAATTGAYKNGTYTGSVADAFYGNLQAVAVIQNGQLTDVQFPTYPSDGGHTLQLSKSDLPILKQEAIASQSAKVNIISGATQTSQAFEQSLASALAQAK